MKFFLRIPMVIVLLQLQFALLNEMEARAQTCWQLVEPESLQISFFERASYPYTALGNLAKEIELCSHILPRDDFREV